ncbi:FAD-dependent oxidoreductase [Litoreibacter roseus]|uniref:FAD-dependent oxidoreductase n=1 Tax=Litoreibacter roseus TaxID=2601869 RepID=A0A6N6JF11_9RHOB|nr:FAD-dependent oxidoreductase [Litoreibacter roseus]GFE64380.1 FAD-dependent oxidoreductase [Litoreibacter roseus]
MAYDYQPFEFTPPPGLTANEPRHKVVIVGAGPIGLAAALELARHDVPSVVVDDNNVVSIGSRAICWSKRSLEIFDRLGIAERMLAKGVTWKVGRTYHGAEEVFNFDLLPEDGHKMPAFINLQQYYVEQYLVEAAQQSPLIDLRFKNKVTDLSQTADSAQVEIETPDGAYTLAADYLLACDGAGSPIRKMMGLEFDGELFEDRFLIADIEMEADFPSERRFWFEPEFHEGQSALLHRQPDNIYRIDLQLGWDADPDHEKKPEVVIPRIERVVGHSDFRLDWVSVYTFQCRRLERFVHDRVIFVGDSAHVVSPFGARGGNGGMQDVDNLGWKLAAVVRGGDTGLLETYDSERQIATDENIANSTRATKFMTPDDGIERLFRDQTLTLAKTAGFARGWVNSGRLSRPCAYPNVAPDDGRLPEISHPGLVAPDAPQGDGWLMDHFRDVTVMAIGCAPEGAFVPELNEHMQRRYLGEADSCIYLVRPDQVIAARWVSADSQTIAAAKDALMRGQL